MANEYLVYLSAGHGGSDPGAVAYGMKEKDINLRVMLTCKAELERHGVSVVASRTKDENDPVAQEVREANASGAVIAASFHVNAAKGDGSETFCNKGNPDGVRLARLMEQYTQELGQNSRGVKDGTHLYFIRKTTMTSVLSEIGFIDNDTDNNIFDTVAEQEAFGKAYAKAILAYFGISYKEPGTVPVSSDGSFLIRAKGPLSVRTGPGVGYKKVMEIDSSKRYTIVETKKASDGGTWGKLKSGAGWVNVGSKYVNRV